MKIATETKLFNNLFKPLDISQVKPVVRETSSTSYLTSLQIMDYYNKTPVWKPRVENQSIDFTGSSIQSVWQNQFISSLKTNSTPGKIVSTSSLLKTNQSDHLFSNQKVKALPMPNIKFEDHSV